MNALWMKLVLVALLVLLNAAFAGTELALVSLRESQLRRLERRSATGAVLARLARDPNRFLATIQIGITLAGFLASATAAVSLAEPVEERLGALGSAAGPVSVILVTIALSYLTLVFGELAPKRVAMQRAERWGLLAARPLNAMAVLTRPVVWLLSASTDLAVRLLGGDPTMRREEVTKQELRDMVTAQSTFTPQQRRIIDGAFEIADRTLDQVLRPRPDVFVLDAAQPAADALRDLTASGYSRAPVAHERNLDAVIGMVHLRDLLEQDGRPVGELAVEMHAFPETAEVLDALHEMQVRHIQLVLVVDEHGSAAGIVSIEDLLEELVGEIYDETDRDIVGIRYEADGSIVLPGRFPVHDLGDIGVDDVPEGPYATVAGLVLDRLGRVPEVPGDTIEVAGRTYEVRKVTGRAITEVRIGPPSPDSAAVPEDDRAAERPAAVAPAPDVR